MTAVFVSIINLSAADGQEDLPYFFELNVEDNNKVCIGRASENDLILSGKGISAFHAELVLRQMDDEPKLCLKDISANGTGYEDPSNPNRVRKLKGDPDQLVPLPSTFVVVLPLKIKVSQGLDVPPRTRLKVQVESLAEKQVPMPKVGAAPALAGDAARQQKLHQLQQVQFEQLQQHQQFQQLEQLQQQQPSNSSRTTVAQGRNSAEASPGAAKHGHRPPKEKAQEKHKKEQSLQKKGKTYKDKDDREGKWQAPRLEWAPSDHKRQKTSRKA